jgi:signal transduction histidine kinase
VSRTSTLRGRLALVAAVTTAVWVGLLTAGFNLVLASQLHAQASSLLRQRAAAAAATVVIADDGSVQINEPRNDDALDTDLWIFAGQMAVERPRASQRLQQLADALAQSGERFAETGEPSSTRMFALPVRVGDRQVATVVSAVSLDPYRNVARLALLGSIGLALLLLAAVYAATRLIVARALAPVQQMSTQAARWSKSDAAQRFGVADRPGELALLATNLDGVLDRLAALLRHEQQVTEELSHELRTPLSVISAEAELLLGSRRRTAAETSAGITRIAEGASRMSHMLETLLSAARSRSPDTTGRCVVRSAVEDTIDHVPGGHQVAVQPGPAGLAVGVDAVLVERILTPLLENADRYARSRIDVAITEDPAGVVITVTDDGPGVDPSIGDAVFEPGRRDPVSSPSGAGLGLALARRLARAAGGDVLLVDGAFEVRLPRA